jgi:protease I
MTPLLNGLHIALMVADGFEQTEFSEAKSVLEREGAITKIVSEERGAVRGFRHDAEGEQFNVDLTIDEIDPADFDAVVLPGGSAHVDRLRNLPKAQEFLQGMGAKGKPIVAGSHAAALLLSAGLAQGRRMTSWPAMQDEMRSAGGDWLDEPVVVDGNILTSRTPDDTSAFVQKMVEVIAGRMKAGLSGTADEHAVGIASS